MLANFYNLGIKQRRIRAEKKMLVVLIIALLVFGFCRTSWAYGVNISDVELTNPDATQKIITIKFNISWTNSFRFSNFYDAVWVFGKYSKDGTTWKHIKLKTEGQNWCRYPSPNAQYKYSIKTNDQTNSKIFANLEILVPSDKVGCFIQPATQNNNQYGIRDVDAEVNIVWDWGSNGLQPSDKVKVKLFAIEMVRIPRGSFSLGMTSDYSTSNCFYKYGSPPSTYQIGGESAITLIKQSPNLCYSNLSGSVTLPNDYPKGYNAFYIMKYEVTQKLYSEFLNTIGSSSNSRFMNQFGNNRNFITQSNGTYGCDANNNGVLNDYADGQDIACNFLSINDALYFADWAGLRPMSEFEFEKAARGGESDSTGNYVWGNQFIKSLEEITEESTASEAKNTYLANCNIKNMPNPGGPVRVGLFSYFSAEDAMYKVIKEDTRRILAGASYYGVMELAGNVAEICVGTNSDSVSFKGSEHGDGDVSSLPSWPTAARAYGLRGGGWSSESTTRARTADRQDMSFFENRSKEDYRDSNVGFRAVRTAPD